MGIKKIFLKRRKTAFRYLSSSVWNFSYYHLSGTHHLYVLNHNTLYTLKIRITFIALHTTHIPGISYSIFENSSYICLCVYSVGIVLLLYLHLRNIHPYCRLSSLFSIIEKKPLKCPYYTVKLSDVIAVKWIIVF